MTQGRTYRWYANHDFLPGGREYSTLDDDKKGDPLWSTPAIEGCLEPLGIIDTPVTYENFVPLYNETLVFAQKSEKDPGVFHTELKKGGVLFGFDQVVDRIVQDPRTDPRILTYVAKNLNFRYNWVLFNPSLPVENFMYVINTTKKKDVEYIMSLCVKNPSLPPEVIDWISKKSRQSYVQKFCVNHPSVTRETLVFLSKESKFETVRNLALRALVDKGLVTVN